LDKKRNAILNKKTFEQKRNAILNKKTFEQKQNAILNKNIRTKAKRYSKNCRK